MKVIDADHLERQREWSERTFGPGSRHQGAIVAKQTKNEGRVWPDWRTADPNAAIEHDRSHDTQDVPS